MKIEIGNYLKAKKKPPLMNEWWYSIRKSVLLTENLKLLY